MKIIFSPTKEMKFDNEFNQDWELTDSVIPVLNSYQNIDTKELKKALKVNDSVFDSVKEFKNSFNTAKTYQAIYMYNGLSFRTLAPQTLSKESISYLDSYLLILSAFYGPIKPLTLIKPYRLDFLSSLKVEGNSLSKYWRPIFNNSISQKETVINLASNEFSDLFDKSKYNWIDFEFYEIYKGSIRQHSTVSKKGRATILRYLAENLIEDVEDIKSFEGYEITRKGNLFEVVKL